MLSCGQPAGEAATLAEPAAEVRELRIGLASVSAAALNTAVAAATQTLNGRRTCDWAAAAAAAAQGSGMLADAAGRLVKEAWDGNKLVAAAEHLI